jgi:hypothetical protein
MGCAGAWAYVHYLDPILAGRHRTEAQTDDKEKGRATITEVGTRVDDLSGKLDRLQSTVDHVSRTAAPPDLEPIDKRLSALESLPRKIETLDGKVSALPTKIDQEARKVTVLTAELEGVRSQVKGLQSELPIKGLSESAAGKTERPVSRGTAATPGEITPPAVLSLHNGVELFNQKKYGEASEYFEKLTKTNPDDARNWYYAALSRGLATRDWKGQTERLVTEGLDREKAGKPERSEIDSAFTDLNSQTGKDWLAFYRRRAL